MGLGTKIKRVLGEERVDGLRTRVHELAEQSTERHLRVAVTGLSRAGKTVFISALVHHLLQAPRSRSLPFFGLAASDRIISVKDLSGESASPFPLASALDGLCQDPPHWPASTTGLSEVRLAIRYRREAGLRRLLGESGTLYLDIIDYPGEWLLDLPLLTLDFRQWSQQQQQLFAREPRASLSASWREALAQIDWNAPADEQRLQQLSQQYAQLLQQFRAAPQSLSLLQPGRCILPGELAGDPRLELFPLLLDQLPEAAAAGSFYAVMAARYERYKREVVAPFYTRHFSRFDRQVVLVDCLKTLNQGQACFDDMKQALGAILHSFNYGRSGFLRRLFSPRIDKVLFASTKADHVTANQHHNLDRFLELIIEEAQRDIRFEGIETRCMAIASIRSTSAAEATIDGQTLSCLKGVSKESGEPLALFPGEVPIELPGGQEWSRERFRFIDFAPVRLPRNDLQPRHHIRLDQVLEYLTGDLFQ